jgi:hypothetical protein
MYQKKRKKTSLEIHDFHEFQGLENEQLEGL